MHNTDLISTIVISMVAAFAFGFIASRFRLPPLVGYLIAGIAVGPHTPGFVADSAIAQQLAEIGVILLMFGVGLHFSLKDLMSVRSIAVPGAVIQIVATTLIAMWVAHMFGWPLVAGIVYGLSLSVASTVVLLRALQERRLVTTERGRMAVGWLIVEDLVMVLALVMIPTLTPLLAPAGSAAAAGGADVEDIVRTIALTIAKVAAFFAVMLLIGRAVIPWILHRTAHSGSRELFRMAVLSIALGVAYASAQVFGVSFALGAFFAGVIMSESALSQQAAAETLPFRDAFAVLFFVSVGMLFNPFILVEQTIPVIATLLTILLANTASAILIVLAFGYPLSTALFLAVSLAQIGEFSFILASLGVGLKILPETGRDLILAGAILSILLNPLLFDLLDRLKPWLEKREGTTKAAAKIEEPVKLESTKLTGHTVLVGYGRVGRFLVDGLTARGEPLFVIEESLDRIKDLKARGIEAQHGNAVKLLDYANLPASKALLIAVPDGFEAGDVVEQARKTNPNLPIIARAYSDAEVSHLRHFGASFVILGDQQIAQEMLEQIPKGEAPA